MELGEVARKTIKGHDLTCDLNSLAEVREQTLAEFRKRDDDWLMTVDKVGLGADQQLLPVVPRRQTRIRPQWADQIPGEATARSQAEQRTGTLIPGDSGHLAISLSEPLLW
jgi:hypothetical protein